MILVPDVVVTTLLLLQVHNRGWELHPLADGEQAVEEEKIRCAQP